MDNLISLKRHNYEYAPGLATYGIDGQLGEQGDSGNNIYYTNYIINNKTSDDFKYMVNAIKNNMLPIKNQSIEVSRPYLNNDIFFDMNGVIWQLYDYNKIISSLVISKYSDYFKMVGKIMLEDTKYFTTDSNTGKLVLNTSNYKGFDIITGEVDTDTYIDENMAMNIVSSLIDNKGLILLLKFTSLSNNALNDGYIKLYYDTTTNSYHISSDKPIVIDSNVQVKDGNIYKYDDFSSILTYDDTITYFHKLCDDLTYNVTEDTSGKYLNIIPKNTDASLNDLLNLIDKITSYTDLIIVKVVDTSNNTFMIPLEPLMYNYSPDGLFVEKVDLTGADDDNRSYVNVSIYDYVNDTSVIANTATDLTYLLTNNIQYEGTIRLYDPLNYDISTICHELIFYKETELYNSSSTGFVANEHILIPHKMDKTIGSFTFKTPNEGDFRLVLSGHFNFANKSTHFTDVSIINANNMSNFKHDTTYTVYYEDYCVEITKNDTAHCDILFITPDLTIKFKNSNIVPTVKLELPDNTGDVALVSLLHNVEIFIQKLNLI